MESLRMMVGQKVGVRRITYFLSCPFFLHPTGINLLAYIFLNAIQISMNLFLQVTFEPVLSGSVLRGHLCYLVKVPIFFSYSYCHFILYLAFNSIKQLWSPFT